MPQCFASLFSSFHCPTCWNYFHEKMWVHFSSRKQVAAEFAALLPWKFIRILPGLIWDLHLVFTCQWRLGSHFFYFSKGLDRQPGIWCVVWGQEVEWWSGYYLNRSCTCNLSMSLPFGCAISMKRKDACISMCICMSLRGCVRACTQEPDLWEFGSQRWQHTVRFTRNTQHKSSNLELLQKSPSLKGIPILTILTQSTTISKLTLQHTQAHMNLKQATYMSMVLSLMKSQWSGFSTSTTPQGYIRPLTLRPFTSMIELAPTTAKGTAFCKHNTQC